MQALYSNFFQNISRRSFLKLAGQGLGSLFLLPVLEKLPASNWLPPGQNEIAEQGRVLNDQVGLYDRPSYDGELKHLLWMDAVLPITGVTVSEGESDYNPVWYEIEDQGFVHSGSIQPVDTKTNSVRADVPEDGFLVEVSVPYTDILWNPKYSTSIAYRLYYSTTHWVTRITEDSTGKLWYRIEDDKWGYLYYADPAHLRPVTLEDISPLSPKVPDYLKRLEVRLAEQLVVAYEDNQPVFMARAATGAKFSNGDFRTPPGEYITNRKRPSRHMASGDRAAANSYDLPGVPWVCYITESGIAFHGTYWHNDFGKPRSHGCINVSSDSARWIYRWTFPSVSLDKQTHNDETGTFVQVI